MLIQARLGVSRPIYVDVNSPNLGFPYFIKVFNLGFPYFIKVFNLLEGGTS